MPHPGIAQLVVLALLLVGYVWQLTYFATNALRAIATVEALTVAICILWMSRPWPALFILIVFPFTRTLRKLKT